MSLLGKADIGIDIGKIHMASQNAVIHLHYTIQKASLQEEKVYFVIEKTRKMFTMFLVFNEKS